MFKKFLTVFLVLAAVLIMASCAENSDKKYFVVTFCGDYVKTETVNVLEGELAHEPVSPTREGYCFLYWMDDLGNEYKFNEPIKEDITLYAAWELIPVKPEEQFTVRFFGLDGKQIGASQNVKKGQSAKPPALATEDFYIIEWDKSFDNVTSDLDIYTIKRYNAASTDLFSFEYTGNAYRLAGVADGAKLPHMSNGLVKLALPEEYNNLPVTSVGDRAFENKNIYSLYIPSSYKALGRYSFNANPWLSNVVFCEGLTQIGDGAFMASDKIAKFTSGVVHLGFPAYASALSSLAFPSTLVSIGDYAFYQIGRLCEGNNYTELQVRVEFGKCSKLKHIGDHAFEGVMFSSLDLSGVKDDLYIGNYSFAADTYTNWVRLDSYQYPRSVLSSLTLPDSVSHIGDYAFYGCGNNYTNYNGSIYNNKLPVEFNSEILNVSSVGIGAFYNVALRGELSLSTAHVGEYSFFGQELSSVRLSGVNTIGQFAFARTDCISDINVDFGKKLITIGDGAFYNNVGLKSITFPATLVSIGANAFDGCTTLSGDLVLPASLSRVGSLAFRRTGIESVEIRSSVKLMKQCFAQCASLSSVTGKMGSLEESVFYGCKSLEKVELPELPLVPSGLFYGCESLKSITLPSSITEIGDSAFYGCVSLERISVPSEVARIGKRAFQYCVSLESVSFDGESLWDVNMYAFCYCYRLKRIELPQSVVNIGDYAFAGSGITEFKTPAALKSMGYGVFYQHEYTFVQKDENGRDVSLNVKLPVLETITIGRYTEKISFDIRGTFVGSAILGFDVEDENEYYSAVNGILYSADHKKLIMYIRSEQITHIELAEGLEEIEKGAFMNSVGLVSIDMPASLITIGDYAFYNCPKLESISLPSGLVTIGDYAFAGSNNNYSVLKKIGFNGSIVSIGRYAFANNNALNEVQIPASVESIGDHAFYNCSMLETLDLYLAKGLNYIGERAFGGDTHESAPKLKSVDFSACISLSGTGQYVFAECSKLKYVEFGDLSRIDRGAFADCVGLVEIKIGSLITDIDAYAFSRCTGLKKITIPKDNALRSIMAYAFAGSIEKKMTYDTLDLTNATELNTISEGAFAYGNLVKATMPTSLYKLGDEVFDRCSNLASIDLGGVFEIGENVFRFCTDLKTLNIPASVTTINKDAFCDLNIEVVNIGTADEGNSISYLGKSAFFNCQRLKIINIYGDNVPMLSGNEYNLSFHCSDGGDRQSVIEGLVIVVDDGMKYEYLNSSHSGIGWRVYADILYDRSEIEGTSHLLQTEIFN